MTIGKLLAIAGIVLLLLGLIIQYAPWLVNWFGHLPGDIRIKNENSRVFIPLTSMIIVSVVLSMLVNLFFRK